MIIVAVAIFLFFKLHYKQDGLVHGFFVFPWYHAVSVYNYTFLIHREDKAHETKER